MELLRKNNRGRIFYISNGYWYSEVWKQLPEVKTIDAVTVGKFTDQEISLELLHRIGNEIKDIAGGCGCRIYPNQVKEFRDGKIDTKLLLSASYQMYLLNESDKKIWAQEIKKLKKNR